LPDSQGLNAFATIHAWAPLLPIIILADFDNETQALQAVREGAQDYLVKAKIEGKLLSRSIRYAIERKRIEEALRESEQRYRRLLGSTTDYIYTVNRKDDQSLSSSHGPGCVAVTGYSPDEYEADSDLWFRMIDEADRPAVTEQIKRLLASETVPPLEHRIIHKDGSIRWVRNTPVARKDEQGKVISYDGLISNITERKRAEEALAEERNVLRTLIDTIPDAIYVKDTESRFVLGNREVARLMGAEKAEALKGKTDFDFYPRELAAQYYADEQEVIRSGRSLINAVEPVIDPMGNREWLLTTKAPVCDSRGRIVGLVGIGRNITERKRVEEQQRASEDALRVALAELKTSHEELKAAQLRLIQAEKLESIGTLAAGVAHEVKNPLQTMLMGLEYLSNHGPADDPCVTMVLGDMRDAVGRADSIIRELLEFSASNHPEVADEELNAILEQSLGLMKFELTKHRITVMRALRADLPLLKLDKNKIQQVFINLFLNAIQAMPEGGTLTIRTYLKRSTETQPTTEGPCRAPPGSGEAFVVAEIEDTGPGIPSEKLTKVFDPFFTTKPPGVGSGLGLSVTKKIIELHGGTINIENCGHGGVRVSILFNINGGNDHE
jgi:PAS domain S-box-containing protein